MKYILCIFFLYFKFIRIYSLGVNVGIGQISDIVINDDIWISYILKYNRTSDIKYFWRDINQLEKQRIAFPNHTSAIIAIQNNELPLTLDQSISIINLFKKYTFIKAITVGNEFDIKLNPNEFENTVLASMNILYDTMNKLDIQIPITTPLTMSLFGWEDMILQNEWEETFVNLLHFYNRTNSYLMFNIYPYLSWLNHKNLYTIEYVLSRMLSDKVNQIDKIKKEYGYDNVKLIVGETGWPTNGNEEANINNSYKYWKSIVNLPYDIYWFELLDEDLKPGSTEERYYGLFTKYGEYKFNGMYQ
jgi:exo-beta-1,3-glucanase (GH17 family)